MHKLASLDFAAAESPKSNDDEAYMGSTETEEMSPSPSPKLVSGQTTVDVDSILDGIDIFQCPACDDVNEIVTANIEKRMAEVEVKDIFENLTQREEALIYGFILYSHLEIKDRKHNLTTYPMCFVGTQLVDWCMENGLAASENEGTNIGVQLWTHNIIVHVTGQNGPEFENGAYFYRFIHPMIQFNMEFVRKFSQILAARSFEKCFATANAKLLKRMEKVAEGSKMKMQRHGMIKDRKWRLKTYSQCFVGQEAVDYLRNQV